MNCEWVMIYIYIFLNQIHLIMNKDLKFLVFLFSFLKYNANPMFVLIILG